MRRARSSSPFLPFLLACCHDYPRSHVVRSGNSTNSTVHWAPTELISKRTPFSPRRLLYRPQHSPVLTLLLLPSFLPSSLFVLVVPVVLKNPPYFKKNPSYYQKLKSSWSPTPLSSLSFLPLALLLSTPRPPLPALLRVLLPPSLLLPAVACTFSLFSLLAAELLTDFFGVQD